MIPFSFCNKWSSVDLKIENYRKSIQKKQITCKKITMCMFRIKEYINPHHVLKHKSYRHDLSGPQFCSLIRLCCMSCYLKVAVFESIHTECSICTLHYSLTAKLNSLCMLTWHKIRLVMLCPELRVSMHFKANQVVLSLSALSELFKMSHPF